MSFLLTILEIAFIYFFLKNYGLLATLRMLIFALIMLLNCLFYIEK